MSRQSTMQPFAKGDVFAGCTLLNNPADDHAGPGRIIQYDSQLKEKGVLWTEGTTHLVGGLKFGPDGNLWAFDSNARCVLRVSPEGKQLPRIDFGDRSFSQVNFVADGTLLMGEHLVGNTIKLPPERPLGTTLNKMAGTDRFGDWHLFRFSMDGKLIKEYATATNGGMAGFLGLTTASLAPDGRTVVYSSETGQHLYQYDIETDKQLPDLITHPKGEMALVATHQPDGTLLYLMASFTTGFALKHLAADGTELRHYPLPGPGWANLALTADANTILVGNFFTGNFARMNLESGEMGTPVSTGVERSLAGLAEYRG